ncbi:cation diffusion facilitator family transporter [Candidatus Vecturithrix granuli]|uniref:Cation diffusion facilitator family transporter n=1 Tax=Vecturithrix granuli TaxID=1499967 RepID=A0A081BW02_VECG1|nr:cation diffusion facilitator family transporter [Candidatus Vecturithrix granuli]
MKTEKQRLGYIEGWVSSVLNVALFGLKLWIGMLSGSIAMIADAWHTLSDTLTSLVVLLGFWISGRPRDQEHPFGHGRAEVIASAVIGTLLAVVGMNFIKESYLQLRQHIPVDFTLTGILIFGLSIALKEGLAQFSIWAGRKVNSQALIADGWHHRSDAIASFLIVVGALFGEYFWWIDGVLGVFVSLLILYAAFDILRQASESLLGESIDPKLEQDIQHVITRIAPDTSGMHHPHVHRYGDHLEVTFHLKMNANYSLSQAHEVVSRIESELRATLNIEPTIHAEPLKANASA